MSSSKTSVYHAEVLECSKKCQCSKLGGNVDCGTYCRSSRAELLREVKTHSLAEQLKAGTVALVRCHRAGREEDC